jgi:diguanylate cyclase (GGDEF)-like protein
MPMSAAGASWSTQELVEFLELVSDCEDEPTAVRRAVERAAEALDAEVAAFVGAGRVIASVGFPAAEPGDGAILRVADGTSKQFELPGVGLAGAVSIPLTQEPGSSLIVGRRSPDGFSAEEQHLLRGFARVLSQSLRLLRVIAEERGLRATSELHAAENERLLSSLRERQALLERLSRIQRSIVHRAALQEVLDAIVAGARDLLDTAVVELRLLDPDDPKTMEMVASTGVPAAMGRQPRKPTSDGAGGRAILEERLVRVDNYAVSPLAIPAWAADHVEAAMAAPVRENGSVAGSLVVASRQRGRSFSSDEEEVLLAFAEHASLALTDARNFDAALHQALHDELTGLPNRALFLDRLGLARVRARRMHTPLAVLFLDLDGFKCVNDSFGHAAGDQLLAVVAKRLRECVRGGDTAARFGGDEFAILLDTTPQGTTPGAVADRVLLALKQPFAVSGKQVALSASIGIARTSGDPNDDIMRNADLAMYKAKRAGKGRYEEFEPVLHAAVVVRA